MKYFYIGMTLLYVSLAFIFFGYTEIGVTKDSLDYEAVARLPLFSAQFWGALKAPGLCLFYKLVSGISKIAVSQLMISLCSWILLAAIVSKKMSSKILKILSFSVLLLFGLSGDVFFWNKQMLSESLSTSLFVLMTSLALSLAFRWDQLGRETYSKQVRWAFFFLFVAGYWASIRDTNAYFVLGAVCITILVRILYFKTVRHGLVFLGVCFVGALSIFAASNASSNAGHRWQQPLINTLGKRILPYPEKVDYFAKQGMPINPEVLRFSDKWAGSYDWSGFGTWLSSGQAKHDYMVYLIKNFKDSIQGPIRDWGAIFEPELYGYFGLKRDSSLRKALTYAVYYRGGREWLLAAVCFFLGLLLLFKGRQKPSHFDPSFVIPVAMLLLVYPMAFLGYHGDAMETERHAYGVALQGRVGLWLFFFLALNRLHWHKKT